MTYYNALAQLWTDKSSHPVVDKFLETVRRGSSSHDDVSLQALDSMKTKLASSRIFIFANNWIYTINGKLYLMEDYESRRNNSFDKAYSV